MPIDLSNCVLNARKVICELEDLEKKMANPDHRRGNRHNYPLTRQLLPLCGLKQYFMDARPEYEDFISSFFPSSFIIIINLPLLCVRVSVCLRLCALKTLELVGSG